MVEDGQGQVDGRSHAMANLLRIVAVPAGPFTTVDTPALSCCSRSTAQPKATVQE